MGNFGNAIPEINPLVKVIIEHLFFEKILLSNQIKASIADQMDMKKIHSAIMDFIYSNPNNNFLLQSMLADNVVELGISFGNYEEENDNTGEYIIQIDQFWSSFQAIKVLTNGFHRVDLDFKTR